MAVIRSTRHRRRRTGESGSFWISFSDLMSSLLLIFILIMFYIMYQYFDMYEINKAEIARQQFDLDEANAALTAQQAKLSAAEEEMIAQQIRLNAAQADLEDAESVLSLQKEQLNAAQSLLSEKEDELAAQQEKLDSLSIQLGSQQSQLDAQQEKLALQQSQLETQQSQIATQQQQLENQQQQLEQLVGVRTRIITDLSEALRSSQISATVDPTSGAIALASDVLFPTGNYVLSAEGQRRINEFLPVYLNVLFSEQYRDYIAEVIIEGHTDSDGGYIMNLALSQRRALAVASYVLADNYTGISAAQRERLRQVATVNGRSYVDRIMEGGVENKDASRRVIFKFRLTDEEMIAQLQQILEGR